MTDIEHFEPFEIDGIEESSPEWLIVLANKVDGFPWDDAQYFLAIHDPLTGFVSSTGDLLHKVQSFHITELATP